MIHSKQIRAIKTAIDELTDARRRKFAAGEDAYRRGIREQPYQGGVGFAFAEEQHKMYVQYTQDIQELKDLIEILTDPGVTVDPEYIQEAML